MAYIHGTHSAEQERLATLNRLINPAFLSFLGSECRIAKSILEVGSGLGILTREVAARWPAAEVVGVEYSDEQLREATAREAPHNLRFLSGDAHSLPFSDGRFDAVYCRFVLEHVARPEVVCGEMYRVLAPGGRAFVQENEITLQRFDPPTPHFDALWHQVAELQIRLGGDALVGSKLFRLLQGAGFGEVELSVAPEVFIAGQPELVTWIENLAAIVRGCQAELLSHGLATPAEIDVATNEIAALRERSDASSWFCWNRAIGRKPG